MQPSAEGFCQITAKLHLCRLHIQILNFSWYSHAMCSGSISLDKQILTASQTFPIIRCRWSRELLRAHDMRHAPLNRLEAAAGRAHNGAENHDEASSGIALSKLCFGFVFTPPFLGSTFPPQLRFSCSWGYFIFSYFFVCCCANKHDGQLGAAAARVPAVTVGSPRHRRRDLHGRMEEAVPGKVAPHLRGLVDDLQRQREDDVRIPPFPPEAAQ